MGSLDFRNKTVLVVGGTGGIGNGIARAFKDRQAEVYVWGTRPTASDYQDDPDSDLDGLAFEQMDVSDQAALGDYSPAFDRLDVLVLSHGIVMWGGREYQPDNFKRVMDVNVTGVLACCVKFQEMLAANAGTILILNSVGAFRSNPQLPAYNASKAALESLTRTLALDWAEDGIRVNGIAPGMIPTRMTQVAADDPKRVAAYVARVPLGRTGKVENVADLAVFLSSPSASYLTGLTIPVEGGRLLT